MKDAYYFKEDCFQSDYKEQGGYNLALAKEHPLQCARDYGGENRHIWEFLARVRPTEVCINRSAPHDIVIGLLREGKADAQTVLEHALHKVHESVLPVLIECARKQNDPFFEITLKDRLEKRKNFR